MTRRILLLSLGALVLLASAGVIFVLLTAPRVEMVFPARGAEGVLPGTQLEVTFTRPMRTESVESRLEVSPPREGVFTWQDETVTFRAKQPWPKGETITVTLQSGAQSTLGIPLLRTQSWSFHVSRTLLVYLWPSEGPANIYTLDLINGDTRQLTQHTTGVESYSLTPNGLSIYYSVSGTQGNSQILHLDRLYGETTQILDCAEALCDNPQVSPNGDYMAYERTPLGPSGETGRIQVWLLPLDGGEPRPASSQTSHSPDWSPSGLLTFYDEDQSAFKLLDPTSGESASIPNETGEPGTWSPNGDLFVVSEIIFISDNDSESPPFTSHLLEYNQPALNRVDLSTEDNLEDGNPVFSPEGAQLAFARRYLDEERWTPGRQLWLMKPDGEGAIQLTEDANFQHSNFAWNPDGEQLAYVRYNLTTLTDPPEIWTIDSDGGEAVRLVINGYDPQWLP